MVVEVVVGEDPAAVGAAAALVAGVADSAVALAAVVAVAAAPVAAGKSVTGIVARLIQGQVFC